MSPILKISMMLACLAGTGRAVADVDDIPDNQSELDRFHFRAGAYILDSSTRAQVNGRGGNFGSILDFEDNLNLDRQKDTLLLAGRWRFHDRHFLEFEYFDLKRFGNKVIEEEIRFGDSVFPVRAELDTSFSTEVTRISYAYRVVKRPDWGIALNGGLHLTRLRAILSTSLSSTGDSTGAIREIASVSAPLPVVGLSAAKRLGEKWTLLARGQWFFLEIDDVAGALTHAAVHIEHDTFKNFGFGLGYDWFDIDVDTSEDHWNGSADVQFKGPMIFIKASF